MAKKLTEDETNKFLELILEACELADWVVGFDADADQVKGMIIGDMEYVTQVHDALEQVDPDFKGLDLVVKDPEDDPDKIIH